MEPITARQVIGWSMFGGGMIIALTVFGLTMRATFAPVEQNIERNVYQNSASYIQGKDQAIAKQRLEYDKTQDPDVKSAISGYVLHEASTVDRSKLSPQNRSFINRLEQN